MGAMEHSSVNGELSGLAVAISVVRSQMFEADEHIIYPDCQHAIDIAQAKHLLAAMEKLPNVVASLFHEASITHDIKIRHQKAHVGHPWNV